MGIQKQESSNQTSNIHSSINHHQHPLQFSNLQSSSTTTNSYCSSCKLHTSGPVYTCIPCNFFLHPQCYEPRPPFTSPHPANQTAVMNTNPNTIIAHVLPTVDHQPGTGNFTPFSQFQQPMIGNTNNIVRHQAPINNYNRNSTPFSQFLQPGIGDSNINAIQQPMANNSYIGFTSFSHFLQPGIGNSNINAIQQPDPVNGYTGNFTSFSHFLQQRRVVIAEMDLAAAIINMRK